jgi:hypothetical protein
MQILHWEGLEHLDGDGKVKDWNYGLSVFVGLPEFLASSGNHYTLHSRSIDSVIDNEAPGAPAICPRSIAVQYPTPRIRISP